MNCVVFYESWQMECCGTEFSVGDTVKWLVRKAESLNTPVNVGVIDYCYEAHDSDWQKLFVIEGTVEAIKILYHKYSVSSNDSRLLIPVSGETIETKRAKGFDKEINGMESYGYIVTLHEYTIRPAKKEEVTFC